MMFSLVDLLLAAALFAAMLAAQEWGRRLGERDRRSRPASEKRSNSPSEGAVYGLLGLFLAFTFSGAASRFDERRHLVVQEANAVGTAWLRIDLLPENARPAIRDLFKQYLDARLEFYRAPPLSAAAEASKARFLALQGQIWSSGVAAGVASGQVPPLTLFVPAVNEMFDIANTREVAMRLHPPAAVFVMVAILSIVGALFAGFGMAGERRPWLQLLGFAGVMTVALFVIIDLEFPRVGLIRLNAVDSVLTDVRRSMP